MLFSTSAASGLFSTTNWEGWKLNRMPSFFALAPKARNSASLSRTMEWNCGMSGWVA
jgi:hypothetical protein